MIVSLKFMVKLCDTYMITQEAHRSHKLRSFCFCHGDFMGGLQWTSSWVIWVQKFSSGRASFNRANRIIVMQSLDVEKLLNKKAESSTASKKWFCLHFHTIWVSLRWPRICLHHTLERVVISAVQARLNLAHFHMALAKTQSLSQKSGIALSVMVEASSYPAAHTHVHKNSLHGPRHDLKLLDDGGEIPKSKGRGWRFNSRLWNLLSTWQKLGNGLSAFCLGKK